VIFAFQEDGTAYVLDSEAAAQRWEPIDVESQVVVFYAEDGTWLEPRFTRPNRRRFFGLLLRQGAFELVRNPVRDPAVDPIEVALDEAGRLEPNPRFKTLDDIRAALARR